MTDSAQQIKQRQLDPLNGDCQFLKTHCMQAIDLTEKHIPSMLEYWRDALSFSYGSEQFGIFLHAVLLALIKKCLFNLIALVVGVLNV